MKIFNCPDCGVEVIHKGGRTKRCSLCAAVQKRKVSQEYHSNNRDRILKNWADWYSKNGDVAREKARQRYKYNPERAHESYKKSFRRIEARFKYSVRNAQQRNREWGLSLEEYKSLLINPCFYCGGPLNETAIGLDRKDNRLGYVLGNVVPCCKKCNFRKGNLESAGFVYPRTSELMFELQEFLKCRQ